MGNGAGVQVTQFEKLSKLDISHFDDIERRCKRGFYTTHTDEFRQDLKNAIKRSRIDILEVLLTSASMATEIYPLHLAATYGSLDSLELLISAGYSATALDANRRTPLHCSSLCRAPGSNSCADFLALQNKKALIMRDVDGSTPLAIAASRQNVAVVDVLLQHGPKAAAITDKKGRTPYAIATQLQNEDLMMILGGKKESGKEVKKTKEQQQIDEARIMQVWEKFFENCFLSLEAEANYDAGLIYDKATVEHIASQQNTHNRTAGRDESSRFAMNELSNLGLHENNISDLSDHIIAWFGWILCSNQTDPDGEEYYAINVHNYYSKWLSELVIEYSYAIKSKSKNDMRLESFGTSSKSGKYKNEPEVSYPSTAEQVFQEGWIGFFDTEINECYWMQLSTGRCEMYLPIGDDYDNIVNLGLEFYEGDTQWVRPNQYPCSQSWVCVPVALPDDVSMYYAEPLPPPEERYEPSWVADEKSVSHKDTSAEKVGTIADEKYEYDPGADNNGYMWDENVQEWVYQYPQQDYKNDEYADYNYQKESAAETEYYFYNTFSGQSVWFEPIGWEELVELEWNGWWLCREELTGTEYWWNPGSDESQLV